MTMTNKEWWGAFWREHGERHIYFVQSWVVLFLLYWLLDTLRPQIEGLMLGLAMLWVKQVRGFAELTHNTKPKIPKEDDQPKTNVLKEAIK